jgi:hypothetical protein
MQAVKAAAAELMCLDCPGLDKLWLAQLLPDAAPASLSRSGLGSWPSRLVSPPGSSSAVQQQQLNAFGVTSPAAAGAVAKDHPSAADAGKERYDEPLGRDAAPAVDLVDLTLDDEEWVGQWQSDEEAGHSSEEEGQQQQQQQHDELDADYDDGIVVIDDEEEEDGDQLRQQQQQRSFEDDEQQLSPRQQLHSSSWPWLSSAWQQQQRQKQKHTPQQQREAARSAVDQMLGGGKTQQRQQPHDDGNSLLQMLGHRHSSKTAAAAGSEDDEESFRELLARIDANFAADKRAAGVSRLGLLDVL